MLINKVNSKLLENIRLQKRDTSAEYLLTTTDDDNSSCRITYSIECLQQDARLCNPSTFYDNFSRKSVKLNTTYIMSLNDSFKKSHLF